MLTLLAERESELPRLLRDPDVEWKSLLVNDEDPFVERVWTSGPDWRLYLHLVYPCRDECKPLEHPHRAPSAMRMKHLDDGAAYEMRYGVGEKGLPPSQWTLRRFLQGEAYEMTSPDEWHSVNVRGPNPAWTVMVMGPLFPNAPRERTVRSPLGPLLPNRFSHVFEGFRSLYPL